MNPYVEHLSRTQIPSSDLGVSRWKRTSTFTTFLSVFLNN